MLGMRLYEDPSGLSEDEIRKELTALFPSAAVRAQRNSINRTLTAMRTFISKHSREDLALKAATVKDALKLMRASRGMTSPRGELHVLPEPISLKRYGARETRKGVTVKVRKSSGRKVLKRGFLVKKYGNHPFTREGEDRTPIGKAWGPSVRIEVEQFKDELEKFNKKTFDKRLREQLNWEIEKARRR